MRILIVGGPRTGKTTLARYLAQHLAVPVKHTDDLIERLSWSEQSNEVARWLDEPGPWLIEGVAAVRALRRWLAAHPEGRPCEAIYRCTEPVVELTARQETMAKGEATIWSEVNSALRFRNLIVSNVVPGTLLA